MCPSCRTIGCWCCAGEGPVASVAPRLVYRLLCLPRHCSWSSLFYVRGRSEALPRLPRHVRQHSVPSSVLPLTLTRPLSSTNTLQCGHVHHMHVCAGRPLTTVLRLCILCWLGPRVTSMCFDLCPHSLTEAGPQAVSQLSSRVAERRQLARPCVSHPFVIPMCQEMLPHRSSIAHRSPSTATDPPTRWSSAAQQLRQPGS